MFRFPIVALAVFLFAPPSFAQQKLVVNRVVPDLIGQDLIVFGENVGRHQEVQIAGMLHLCSSIWRSVHLRGSAPPDPVPDLPFSNS